MNNPLPSSFFSGWLPYVQAFGPSAVALIAAIIAARIAWLLQTKQYEVARQVKDIAHRQSVHAETKLRLDLFQHRFAAYEEVLDRIQTVRAHSLHNKDFDHLLLQNEFSINIRPIRYLFNDDIYDLLAYELLPALDNHMGNIGQYQYAPDNSQYKKIYHDNSIASRKEIEKLLIKLSNEVYPFLKVVDD